MEQEVASIIRYILGDSATAPKAYFEPVSESFQVPSFYFPAPRLNQGGYTLSHYKFSYSWQVIVYHSSTLLASDLAQQIATKAARNRLLVPLVSPDGSLAGKCFRLSGIETEDIGQPCTAAINISWLSARPYTEETGEFVKRFITKIQHRS